MNTPPFPYVLAKYRSESNRKYAGNPWVEALPGLPDDATLARALAHLPRFDPTERELAAPVRIQMLDTLQQLVVPLPRLVRLARGVLKMMHTSYGPRKPFSKKDNETLQSLYELQQSGDFVSAKQADLDGQHTLSLIGASGCGKSFGLKRIQGLFPPAIYHESLGKWQLPYIFIEMPYDGESVHTLASEIFAELDRLMPDAGYTRLYTDRKGSNAEQRLAKALWLAYQHAVGMIFIDEHQNQPSIGNEPNPDSTRKRKTATEKHPGKETPLAKLLITASNTSHMPLLMSGTVEMKAMLSPRFSRARRMAGRGSGTWGPLERSGNLAKPGEFELLLMGLWNYQWVRQPVKLTEQWSEFMFKLTQGIPDIMVKLFESSQEAAIAGKGETLSQELVEAVLAKEFVATEFGLTALRTKDRVMLDVVTDLYQPDIVERAQNANQQFVLPKSKAAPIVAKKPFAMPGSASAAASSSGATSAPSIDAGSSSGSARRGRPLRPGPVAAVVSAAVATASDMRATLTPGAGLAGLNVADLGQTFRTPPALRT